MRAEAPHVDRAPELTFVAQRPAGLLARLRRRPRQVAMRVNEPVAAPARRRRLALLLEMQRHVAHQPAELADRADMLRLRTGADLGPAAPHAADDPGGIVQLLGRHALYEQVPVRAAGTAGAQPVAGGELDQRGVLTARPPAPQGLHHGLAGAVEGSRVAQRPRRRENGPDRRSRSRQRVERQELGILDGREPRAVRALIRRAAPPADELALRAQQPHVLRPPRAPAPCRVREARVGTFLMQIERPAGGIAGRDLPGARVEDRRWRGAAGAATLALHGRGPPAADRQKRPGARPGASSW